MKIADIRVGCIPKRRKFFVLGKSNNVNKDVTDEVLLAFVDAMEGHTHFEVGGNMYEFSVKKLTDEEKLTRIKEAERKSRYYQDLIDSMILTYTLPSLCRRR